jgi:uncharacterized membrane protein
MKNWAIVLTFLFSLLLIPVTALAVDFTIDDTQIEAFLQEDGDVQVKEQHTYQFDGDFNGISRTLIPKEETDIQNLQAFEDTKPLQVEQEGNLYKIHRTGSDETVTIDLSYTIQNGMEVYSDLGQFYWPFFDSSNESTYENMDIYVHPPQPTDDVYAIGYDEAEGSVSISGDGIVHFAIGEVDSGENGDIRAAYDSSLFPGATIIEGKTIRGEIQDELAAYEEKMEAYNDRKDTLSSIAPYVVGIFALYLTLLLVWAWRRKRAILWEAQRKAGHHAHLPEKEMSLPATILHMKHMAANGDLLSAALLDLVRKGYVSRKNENEFVVLKDTTDHHHEKLLIQWLFYKVGKDGTFTVDALDEYVEDTENQQAYHEEFMNWVAAVKTEIKQHTLVEKKVGLRWTVAISGLLLIPFTILFGVYDLPMWMFFTLLLGSFFLVFAVFYHPRTLKGAQMKYQWKNFSSNYHTIETDRWNEWMSDEQMQAFIYAIGMNDKNMLNKNEKLAGGKPTAHDPFTTTSSDLVMLMIIASMMTNSFNNAEQTVSAGTGGNSIPGGGSGVGGGGGGSGAF